MGYPTKIATCCHCGTQSVLKLSKGQHSLSCGACGAPLRDLKMLPRKEKRAKPTAVSHRPALRAFPTTEPAAEAKRRKPRKSKRRKSWFKDMAEELFDLVEDVFD